MSCIQILIVINVCQCNSSYRLHLWMHSLIIRAMLKENSSYIRQHHLPLTLKVWNKYSNLYVCTCRYTLRSMHLFESHWCHSQFGHTYASTSLLSCGSPSLSIPLPYYATDRIKTFPCYGPNVLQLVKIHNKIGLIYQNHHTCTCR